MGIINVIKKLICKDADYCYLSDDMKQMDDRIRYDFEMQIPYLSPIYKYVCLGIRYYLYEDILHHSYVEIHNRLGQYQLMFFNYRSTKKLIEDVMNGKMYYGVRLFHRISQGEYYYYYRDRLNSLYIKLYCQFLKV